MVRLGGVVSSWVVAPAKLTSRDVEAVLPSRDVAVTVMCVLPASTCNSPTDQLSVPVAVP